MKKEIIPVLIKTPLFDNIVGPSLEVMLACLGPTIADYKKGDVIALYGDPVSHLSIIINGNVSLEKTDYNGEHSLINILSAGDLFGEAFIFNDVSVYPVTIYANSDCKLFNIPKGRIITPCKSACHDHLTLIKNLGSILSEKVLLLNKKVEYLSIKHVRQKLIAFFSDLQTKQKSDVITVPMNQTQIASYLCISRPSMCRELSRMEADGLIKINQKKVTLVNLHSH